MALSRRTLLRGLGTCMALPALDAMLPRSARASEEALRRYVFVFLPNGAHMAAWTPEGVGSNYTLSESLAPLAPIRDQVLVVSGAANVGGPAGHGFRTRSMLSERIIADRFGRSLDQVLADHLAQPGQFASLQYTSEAATSCSTDQCRQLHAVSWRDEHTSMPRDVHPKAVFQRLFSGVDPQETEAARQLRLRRSRSVLDAVRDDADRLKSTLGTADQQRLDAYFTGVRELELRLDQAPPTSASCSEGPVLQSTVSTELLVDQMIDLIVLTLACDRTRVLTWMLGSSESYRSLDFLGLSSTHHGASHNDPFMYTQMTTWSVGKYADLVQRLNAEIQPNGRTLLDDTFVVMASGMSEGTEHLHDNVPLLIGGRGGGAPQLGRHVVLPTGSPLAGVALALLQAYGAPQKTFGLDGTAAAPLGLV